MWQFITIASQDPALLPVRVGSAVRVGTVEHALTHRQYLFKVLRCDAAAPLPRFARSQREWIKLSELDRYPLSKPQLIVARMLSELEPAARRVATH
jgi:adenine-specific DNA glycosylase